MNHDNMKRRYRTEYYAGMSAAGQKPIAMGYAVTLRGARRSIAVHIVLGEYGFACVVDRYHEKMVCFMRRNASGLAIKDTPTEDGEQPPPVDSHTKVDELMAKLAAKA